MSRAAIITIGDELISGYRLDTNSKWLSKNLFNVNIQNLSVVSVGDDPDTIIEAIAHECDKSLVRYIFITGGIGPTDDDCTYAAIKSFLRSDEYLDKDYLNELSSRFKHDQKISKKLLIKQAMKLRDVEYLPNQNGTALPMFFIRGKITFFVLPGVPSEIKDIYKNSILPKINKSKLSRDELTLRFAGISETVLHGKLESVLKKYHNTVKVSFLPNFRIINLRLINTSEDKNILKEIKGNILAKLGDYCIGEGDITLESAVLKILISQGLTLSLAESCTGGYISKLITDCAGSSMVFKGSIVAYSNEVKAKELNISDDFFKNYGAVSFEVAEEMSKSVARKLNTDIGLSVTGISGPEGGTENKPVGLVYISITYLNKSYTKKFNFRINRDGHRLITASTALNMLRLMLLNKIDFSNKKNN